MELMTVDFLEAPGGLKTTLFQLTSAFFRNARPYCCEQTKAFCNFGLKALLSAPGSLNARGRGLVFFGAQLQV